MNIVVLLQLVLFLRIVLRGRRRSVRVLTRCNGIRQTCSGLLSSAGIALWSTLPWHIFHLDLLSTSDGYFAGCKDLLAFDQSVNEIRYHYYSYQPNQTRTESHVGIQPHHMTIGHSIYLSIFLSLIAGCWFGFQRYKVSGGELVENQERIYRATCSGHEAGLEGGDHPPVRPCVRPAPVSKGPRSPTGSIRD